ncbi:MAG: PorV/PorQ family protein, partial [Elusimicrobia bacterium]|nr:PorV/PorQ family protein [Elusimicrobiota bacterium]
MAICNSVRFSIIKRAASCYVLNVNVKKYGQINPTTSFILLRHRWSKIHLPACLIFEAFFNISVNIFSKLRIQKPIALIYGCFIGFGILIQPFSLFAQDPGTTSSNFLKIPVGARQTALGSAFTAVSDDASAIYYNPSGLAQLIKPEINFTQNKYFEGISQSWLSGVYPAMAGQKTIGFAFNYLSVPSFDAYDNNDNKIGSVSARDMAIYFSYADSLKSNSKYINSFLYGASLKYINERLANEKAGGFALDLGLMVKPKIKNLKFGIMAENIVSSEIKFINEGYKLPFNLKFGSSYKIKGQDTGHWTNFSLDFNFPQDNRNYITVGIENRFYEIFALRVGYNSFGDISDGINLGFGIEAG